MPMELKDRLKYARESIALGQKEMAETLGIGLKSWQVYEQGSSVPGGKVFEALVTMGFNANWLLTGEGEMRLGEPVHGDAESINNKPVLFEQAEVKRADRSPVKAAAVSYIDAMTDVEVAEVIKFLVPQQKPKLTADEELLQSLSPDGKARVRAALEARIKALDDESVNDPAEMKLTGT